jgi:hypothetical protein
MGQIIEKAFMDFQKNEENWIVLLTATEAIVGEKIIL